MANIYKSKGGARHNITIAVIIVLAAFIIYCVWYMADTLSNAQNEEALAATEKAIVKSAVQCYALEGQYPTGIKYLEDNYGLTLDRTKYVYHYESIGANMVPDVKVYPLN